MPVVIYKKRMGVKVHQWTIWTELDLFNFIDDEAKDQRKAPSVFLSDLVDKSLRSRKQKKKNVVPA